MTTYTTQQMERLVNAAKAAAYELAAALNADYSAMGSDEELQDEVEERQKALDELNVSLHAFK